MKISRLGIALAGATIITGGIAVDNYYNKNLDTPELKACQEQNLKSGGKPVGVEWGSNFLQQRLQALGVKKLELRNEFTGIAERKVSAIITMINDAVIRIDNFATDRSTSIQIEPEKWEKIILNAITNNAAKLKPYICQQEQVPLQIR